MTDINDIEEAVPLFVTMVGNCIASLKQGLDGESLFFSHIHRFQFVRWCLLRLKSSIADQNKRDAFNYVFMESDGNMLLGLMNKDRKKYFKFSLKY